MLGVPKWQKSDLYHFGLPSKRIWFFEWMNVQGSSTPLQMFFFHWMPAFHLETRTPFVVTIFRAIVCAYEKHASTIRWACRIWLDNKWLKKRFGLKELKHTLTHAYTPTNAKLYHLEMKRNTKEAELIWIQITHMPQTIRPSLYQVMVLLFIIKHLQAIWTGMREEKNSIKSNEKEEKNS